MKKRILIVVYALLLCVTICFAWLSNSRVNYVEDIQVQFPQGALTISNPEVDGIIGRVNENGQFEKVNVLTIDSKSMVPGSGQKFQIRLKNLAETKAQKIKLGVAIKVWTPDTAAAADDETRLTESVNSADALDMIYLSVIKNAAIGGGANNGDLFDSENSVSVRLSEATVMGSAEEKTYFLWVCGDGNEIVVPAITASGSGNQPANTAETTGELGNYNVTINCSFEFDPEATAEHQNVKIEALAFRVE